MIMKVRQFAKGISKEFPEGYKLEWIAYNEENPDEKIILDNHHGKSLHWHNDEKEENFSEWISLEETKKLFRQKVVKKFGLPIELEK